MLQNDCGESEKLWLYMDMLLTEEDKQKFEKHLKECASCGKLLKEYNEAMELYRNSAGEAISEAEFESALAMAVSSKKRRKFSIVETFEEFLAGVMRHKTRAAFGAAVIVCALAVSYLVKPPAASIPESVPAREVLAWSGGLQAAEVTEIKNAIEYIAEEDEDKFILQNYEEDIITVALYDLDKDLIAIEEEIDQNNF